MSDDFFKLEAIFLFGFRIFFFVNFRHEVFVISAPEEIVAIESTIGNHFGLVFGVVNDIFYQVKVAFKMAVNRFKF